MFLLGEKAIRNPRNPWRIEGRSDPILEDWKRKILGAETERKSENLDRLRANEEEAPANAMEKHKTGN